MCSLFLCSSINLFTLILMLAQHLELLKSFASAIFFQILFLQKRACIDHRRGKKDYTVPIINAS